MATVTVKIYQSEKDQVVEVLKKLKDQTVAVSAIAKEAGINPNRCRFVIDELLQEGKITKIATKQFNPRYVRYKYEVVE